MTNAYAGTPKSSAPAMPPPSSLCPQCQQVEVDAKQYRRGDTEEILYACDNSHAWIVRWVSVTGYAR